MVGRVNAWKFLQTQTALRTKGKERCDTYDNYAEYFHHKVEVFCPRSFEFLLMSRLYLISKFMPNCDTAPFNNWFFLPKL